MPHNRSVSPRREPRELAGRMGASRGALSSAKAVMAEEEMAALFRNNLLRSCWKPGLSAEAGEHLARILRNAQRLDDIIRDLIELSRLEHATAPEAQPTDVRSLVDGVVAGARDGAEAKRIELASDVAALPPRLLVDPGLLHQALANLLDNAVKYTPEGGRVLVSGRMLDEEGGSDSRGARRLELSVADTGPGIAREHVARIFERFYRVDTARSRALGGTGLGLALSADIVRQHGGEILLASDPGEATRFEVVLPLSSSLELPDSKTTHTEPAGMNRRARVLVIDDEKVTYNEFETKIALSRKSIPAQARPSKVTLREREVTEAEEEERAKKRQALQLAPQLLLTDQTAAAFVKEAAEEAAAEEAAAEEAAGAGGDAAAAADDAAADASGAFDPSAD